MSTNHKEFFKDHKGIIDRIKKCNDQLKVCGYLSRDSYYEMENVMEAMGQLAESDNEAQFCDVAKRLKMALLHTHVLLVDAYDLKIKGYLQPFSKAVVNKTITDHGIYQRKLSEFKSTQVDKEEAISKNNKSNDDIIKEMVIEIKCMRAHMVYVRDSVDDLKAEQKRTNLFRVGSFIGILAAIATIATGWIAYLDHNRDVQQDARNNVLVAPSAVIADTIQKRRATIKDTTNNVRKGAAMFIAL